MSIIDSYQGHIYKKMVIKFEKQRQYAIKVVFQTFVDTVHEQITPQDENYNLQMLLLEFAVNELFGNTVVSLESLTPVQKETAVTHQAVIGKYKHDIMNSQVDVREFIVQTDRIALILGGMSDPVNFSKSPLGKTISVLLSEYGGEFPSIRPSSYDSICESVASKTNTMDLYKKMLRGR